MNNDLNKAGRLFWITGMPGAGKSTIAKCLTQHLRSQQEAVVFLDGDQFRSLMGNDLGYSQEDRLRNAWRLAHLAQFIVSEGITVVCATVSLYRKVRSWLRENADNYYEVFIFASMDTLNRRDTKALYSQGAAGITPHVVGVNLEVELPEHPDLLLVNDEHRENFNDIVEQILKLRARENQRNETR